MAACTPELTKVGIIGGGQLGLYLGRAARDLGLQTTVLAASADAPAASACGRVIVGTPNDVEAVERLVAEVDVVTFELEAVSPEVLKYLACRAAAGQVRVAPGPEVMLLLQDKSRQKQWLARQGLPTARYRLMEDADRTPDELVAELGMPLVQKRSQGGYDGLGVQVIRRPEDLGRLWSGPSVVEAFVPHLLELSVVVARGEDGTVKSYAPVALSFDPEANVLETATAPADVPEPVAREALALGERIVTLLEGVGVFAIEMFLTAEHELLINEISPRVHNSGHLTLEACETSQFHQHLLAITGAPLGPVTQPRPAVMRNVLYKPELANLCGVEAVRFVSGRGDVFVHWYGKKEGTPMRKMGHVTALAKDARTADAKAQRAVRALARVSAEVFS